MKLLIIGYMASGKTTFGKALAEKLNVEFIDLDQYIEESEGKTVSEIFKEIKEEGFRRLENEYLKKAVAHDGNVVIACGGGTPCDPDNIELINDNGISIFLETSIPVLISRLEAENEKRPLMAGKSNEEIRLKVLSQLCERLPWYEKAKLRWSGDELETAEEVSTNVENFISSYPSLFR